MFAKEEEQTLNVPFKCQEGREQNVLVAERQRATARIVFSSRHNRCPLSHYPQSQTRFPLFTVAAKEP